jgi:hypothetical protein
MMYPVLATVKYGNMPEVAAKGKMSLWPGGRLVTFF